MDTNKLLKEQSRAKLLAGLISESQYNEVVDSVDSQETIEEGGITYSLLELADHIIKHLMDALNNHSTSGLSTIFKKIGMNRGDVFQLLSDTGILGSALYATIKVLGKEKREKLAELLKNKIKNLTKLDVDLEPEKPLKNTFKNSNPMEESEVHDWTEHYHESPFQKEKEISKPAKPKNEKFHTVYMFNFSAIMVDEKNEPYLFNYYNLNDKDFYPYGESEMDYIGKDEDGTPQFDYNYDNFDINGEVIENYVNDNLNSLSIGDGVDALEEGKDLVKINLEVARELMILYKGNNELKKILNNYLTK